jgi:hypothetical protein
MGWSEVNSYVRDISNGRFQYQWWKTIRLYYKTINYGFFMPENTKYIFHWLSARENIYWKTTDLWISSDKNDSSQDTLSHRHHHSPAVCQGKRPRNQNSFPVLELTHVPSRVVFPPWLWCRLVTKLLHWVAGAVLMGCNPESIHLCHHTGSLHIVLLHLRHKSASHDLCHD